MKLLIFPNFTNLPTFIVENQFFYKAVIGNYYPPLNEYNPEVLEAAYNEGENALSDVPKMKYADDEVNYVLFCKAMNNPHHDKNLETDDDVYSENLEKNKAPMNKIHFHTPVLFLIVYNT